MSSTKRLRHQAKWSSRFVPKIKSSTSPYTITQWTASCTPHGRAAFEYDSVTILTLVEESGKLKIVDFKDFTDPEKRSNFYKTLSEGQVV